MQKESNYDKLLQQWQVRFQQMDPEKLMQMLPELTPVGDSLTLFHFGRKYAIDADGIITAPDDHDAVSVTVALNIYTLFGFCKEHAQFMDKWVPFRDLRSAGPFAPAFHRYILIPLAMTFSGHADALKEAALRIGGTLLAHADVGCQINAFDCIPMQVFFWEGDDEFPAQANFLFDYSATDFIHVESTVSLASECLGRLASAANLPILGSAFSV